MEENPNSPILLPSSSTQISFLNSGTGKYLLDNCINRDYYEQFPVAVWTYLFSTFDEILRGMYYCTEAQVQKKYLNKLQSPKKLIQWCKAQGSRRPDPINLIMKKLGVFIAHLSYINEETDSKNKMPGDYIKHMLEGDLTRCPDLTAVKNCYQDLYRFSNAELISKFKNNRKYFCSMLHSVQFIINQCFLLSRDPDRVIQSTNKNKSNKTTFIPKYQLNMTRGGVKNIDELILIMACFINDVFQDGPRLQCKCCADKEKECDAIDFEERLFTDLYESRKEEIHNPWLHLAICNRLNKITNRFRYESTFETDEWDSQWTFSPENKYFLANEFLSSAFLTLLMQDPDSRMNFELDDKHFGLMTIMGTLGRIFDEEQVDEIGIYGCNVTSMAYLLLAYHHWIDHNDDTQDIDKQIILVLIKHIDKMRSRLIKINGTD